MFIVAHGSRSLEPVRLDVNLDEDSFHVGKIADDFRRRFRDVPY
jgi:hypothetical protein